MVVVTVSSSEMAAEDNKDNKGRQSLRHWQQDHFPHPLADKPLPVPYVPVKDEVQDEVARMRSMEIKTMLEKDTTLKFTVWQENETREAF